MQLQMGWLMKFTKPRAAPRAWASQGEIIALTNEPGGSKQNTELISRLRLPIIQQFLKSCSVPAASCNFVRIVPLNYLHRILAT